MMYEINTAGPAPRLGLACSPVKDHIPVPIVIPRPMNSKSNCPNVLRRLPLSWACRESVAHVNVHGTKGTGKAIKELNN